MKIENRADQCPCIWVDRFDGDVLAGQHLDQISQIHHSHLMRNTLHQCDIMADKADGDILFPLQPGHAVHVSGVHSGARLVENVDHAGQAAAHIPHELEPLRFAARQRG